MTRFYPIFLLALILLFLLMGCSRSSVPVAVDMPPENAKRDEPIAPEFLMLWQKAAQDKQLWVQQPETVARKLTNTEGMPKERSDEGAVAIVKTDERVNNQAVVTVHVSGLMDDSLFEEFIEIILEKKLGGWFPVQQKWSGKGRGKDGWDKGPFQ